MVKFLNEDLLVSVVLPIYNSGLYLDQSLKSLLQQSYQKFEIIAINDGSTDNSALILQKYSDPRLRVYTHTKNRGLVSTLNEGLRHAKGELIARMDPDDIAYKDRLRIQVDYMVNHPDTDIVGSWIKNFGLYRYVWRTHQTHEYIVTKLLFETSLAHPSVVMRRSSLAKVGIKYEENYASAEDLMLWSKLAFAGLKFGNIPQVLLKYRTHSNQTGESQKRKQQDVSWLVRKFNLKKMHVYPGIKEKKIHQKLSSWIPLSGIKEAQSTGIWLSKILVMNRRHQAYSHRALKKIIGERWAIICYLSSSTNFGRLLLLATSPWLLPLSISTFYLRSRGLLYENC